MGSDRIGRDVPPVARITLALALLTGIGLRVWTLASPLAALDGDEAPLVAALDRAHVRHALADYQLAYVLTFETNERILAAPLGQPRHAGQQRAVLADRRRAYVTVAGS